MHLQPCCDCPAAAAGTQKTGTTWLFQALHKHPSFSPALRRPGCVLASPLHPPPHRRPLAKTPLLCLITCRPARPGCGSMHAAAARARPRVVWPRAAARVLCAVSTHGSVWHSTTACSIRSCAAPRRETAAQFVAWASGPALHAQASSYLSQTGLRSSEVA